MNRQRGDVHHQKTGEIKKVEAQRAPIGLQRLADPVVEVDRHQHQEKAEDAGAVLIAEGEDIGKQPPDLSAQNLIRAEAEPVIHLQATVVTGKEVDDQIADADIQHQIRDALVPVPEKKPVKISAKLVHIIPPSAGLKSILAKKAGLVYV